MYKLYHDFYIHSLFYLQYQSLLSHPIIFFLFFFFFNDTATTEIYTLSLHDALPIFSTVRPFHCACSPRSALSVRATTRQPDVSLSRRWTSPSRGSSDVARGGAAFLARPLRRPRSAFTTVEWGVPRAGWATIPAALSRTTTSSSSKRSASGRSWGTRPDGSGSSSSSSTGSPPRSRAAGFATRPASLTRPASTSRWTRERVRSGASRASATSSRVPARAWGMTKERTSGPLTGCPRRELPDPRLHVSLRLQDHVDDRPIVEVRARVQIGRDARAVQVAALLELVAQRVEEVVLLDPADDLLLVVERDVGADRPGEAHRGLGCFDERHDRMLVDHTNGVNERPPSARSATLPRRAHARALQVRARDLLPIEPELPREGQEDAAEVDRGGQRREALRLDVLDVVAGHLRALRDLPHRESARLADPAERFARPEGALRDRDLGRRGCDRRRRRQRRRGGRGGSDLTVEADRQGPGGRHERARRGGGKGRVGCFGRSRGRLRCGRLPWLGRWSGRLDGADHGRDDGRDGGERRRDRAVGAVRPGLGRGERRVVAAPRAGVEQGLLRLLDPARQQSSLLRRHERVGRERAGAEVRAGAIVGGEDVRRRRVVRHLQDLVERLVGEALHEATPGRRAAVSSASS